MKGHNFHTGQLYRHFKGGIYKIVGLVYDEDHAEQLVVYRKENEKIYWLRPLDMFLGVNEANKERFKLFSDSFPLTTPEFVIKDKCDKEVHCIICKHTETQQKFVLQKKQKKQNITETNIIKYTGV